MSTAAAESLVTVQTLGDLTSSVEPFSTRNLPALWMAPSASLEISWGEMVQLASWASICKAPETAQKQPHLLTPVGGPSPEAKSLL